MKNLVLVLLTVFSVLLIGTQNILAYEPATNRIINNVSSQLDTDSSDPNVNIIHGEVIRVDSEKQKLTYKDSATGNQMTVLVADDTTLGNLQPNDRVKITFPNSQTNNAINVVKE